MTSQTTQRLNGMGMIGAALFVISPVWAAYLWQSSMAEFARMMDLLPSLAAKELYPPGAYMALTLTGLVGLVMVIVGREYTTESIEEVTND